MKHTITKLEETKEPIQFMCSILGNLFLETEVGNYTAMELPSEIGKQFKLLLCTRANENDNCSISNVEISISTNLNVNTYIWN
jgi:hypothetical protein